MLLECFGSGSSLKLLTFLHADVIQLVQRQKQSFLTRFFLSRPNAWQLGREMDGTGIITTFPEFEQSG